MVRLEMSSGHKDKIMIGQCCHICPWWHHDCLVSPDILAHCCHNDDQSEDCTAPIWPMRGLLNSNQHVLPQILSPEMVWVCDADTDWDMGQELSSVETMGPGPGHWDPVCWGVWGVERTSAAAMIQIIECSQESEMGLTGNIKSLSKILVDQKFTQAGLFRQDERCITNVHTFLYLIEIDLEQPACSSQTAFSILKSECDTGRCLTAVKGASSGGADKEIAGRFTLTLNPS